MGSDEIWGKLSDLSIVCGMNERIAQHFLAEANASNWWIVLAIVGATFICFGLTVTTGVLSLFDIPESKKWLRRISGCANLLSIAASLLAGIAGLFLIFAPSTDDIVFFKNSNQAWNSLRQDVDSVMQEADSDKPFGIAGSDAESILRKRYGELLQRKNVLNGLFDQRREITNDVKRKYRELEEQSRGAVSELKNDDAPAGDAAGKISQRPNARER